MVLINKKSDRYNIIDGQQRITTSIILNCVFRDSYSDSLKNKAKDYIKTAVEDKYETNKRKLTLLTDKIYQNTFEQTVLKKITLNTDEKPSIENKYTKNKYLQNAHYLKNFIQEKIDEQNIRDINDFLEWIFEQVALTRIVCPNQETAIQIFNVLNDKDMPLSSVDILKSSLMQH